jgi:hypothetical protein
MKSPQRCVIPCRWSRSFPTRARIAVASFGLPDWAFEGGNHIACLSIRDHLNIKSEFYNQNMRHLLITVPRWPLKIRRLACIFRESRSPLKKSRLKNFNLLVQV